jgi:hypothetical protein
MPSTSGKQHRFMEMVAHDPKAAKRVGVPQSVGQDFVQADKSAGKRFKGHPGRMEHLKGRARTSAEK